jgi:hypothetical protein
VLQRAGAQPDPDDPHKWRTDRGVLSVTGAKFMNWNRGLGGGGAIDLVMHLYDLGFGRALEWLELHCNPATVPPPIPATPPPSLALPVPVPFQLNRVRRYLIEARRLPLALLDPLIHCGDLYADANANAVFLLRGIHDQPVGAELRGTTAATWRGMAPGSRKDLGFFALPKAPPEACVLCESAIDAISCHALHPHYRCVSTAGARPNPAWLSGLLTHGQPIYCGFDLDATGEAMAESLIARQPSIRRLRPSRKDWNDVLRLGP